MTDGFPVPGEVFEGRYRISRLIGSGGFARVYYAVQEDLGRDVAIKVLMPAQASDGPQYSEKLVRRFNQEARMVSRLRDPHTITMFDYGETLSGLLYMVFEYIEGRSLSQIVHEDGALAAERVVKVLEATLSSLQEAHAYGVLHRDIKPGNIMLFDYLGRPDQVKLLDFGIAKSLSDKVPGKDITADGALVGTPRYMSPEQIRGQELGPSSDIYSLGLVAYEMLTGHKAIDSNSSVTIIGQQLDSVPFRLPEDAPVSPALREIVDRMLAKDRDIRFDTAEEVLEALTNYRTGKPVSATPLEIPDDRKDTIFDIPEIPSASMDPTMSPASNNVASVSVDDSNPDWRSPPTATNEFDAPERSKSLLLGAIAFGILFVVAAASTAAILTHSGAKEPAAIVSKGDAATDLPDEAETTALAEFEFDAGAARAVEEPEAVEPEPKMVTVMVATKPHLATIVVGDEVFGESPTQVRLSTADFPVEVKARIGDGEVSEILDAPSGSLIMDVSSIAPKSKPETTRRASSRKDREPRKFAPPPEPKPKSETKKEKGLSLPALDL